MVDPLLAGLSCPQRDTNEELLEVLATEYSREWLGRFLARYGERLQQVAPRLGDHLVSCVNDGAFAAEGRPSFGVAWDVCFANIRKAALSQAEEDPAPRAASLGIWLAFSGVQGQWEARFQAPQGLRISAWVLPEAGGIAMLAKDGRIDLEIRSAAATQRIQWRRTDSGWRSDDLQPLPQCQGAQGSEPITLLPSAEEFGEDLAMSHQSLGQSCTSLRQALGVIEAHAPVYSSWVARTTRYVLPVASGETTIRSGSSFEDPGVIQVSFPSSVTAIAEMLVHEASHQYFQLARRLGPVDDGSDNTLYFSPVKQTDRPIDKLLLAYHAFANVLLFYRSCQSAGLDDDGYCARNEAALVPQLETLAGPLRGNPALTSIGRVLSEPLHALIG